MASTDKISYEEAQDSIDIIKVLTSIKNTLNNWSIDQDNALIDDEDRVNLSKQADNIGTIIEKAQTMLTASNLCPTCAEPLERVLIESSDEDEIICRTCG